MYAPDLIARALGSVVTLYMLALLLRWCAPWIEVDLHARRLRWIPRLTDPAIDAMRRLLQGIGGLPNARELAPMAAVLAVWAVRLIALGY